MINTIINKSIYLTGLNTLKIKKISKKISQQDIVIKIESCGICSSDLKFISTGSRIKKYPIILGHEISGTVYKIPKNFKNIKVGNRIVFGAEIPCNKCASCKKFNDDSNLCDNPMSVGSNIDGGFSNYFIINKEIFNSMPYVVYQNKKYDRYDCLSESLACVLNGMEVCNFKKKKYYSHHRGRIYGFTFCMYSKNNESKVYFCN